MRKEGEERGRRGERREGEKRRKKEVGGRGEGRNERGDCDIIQIVITQNYSSVVSVVEFIRKDN